LSPVDAHPVTRRPGTPHTNCRLRLGVRARDRRVLPKQSAEPGTAGGPFEATPARPFPPPSVPAAHATGTRTDKASLGQAPLMRFVPLQHTLAATRCPGQPASGRSRFDVSASRGPRLVRNLHLALVRAVFPPGRIAAMVLAVADACERSVPVESVACAWRRHGGGKTACCSHLVRLRPAGQVRAVKPFPHAHDRSNHLERRRCDSAARTGSLRRRVSQRGVPLPRRPGLSQPDQASGPSLCSPGGAPGVLPFAGLLPLAGGLAPSNLGGYTRRIAAFLPVRAHVPFGPIIRPD
jgi:hypothetical protein